MWIKEDNGIVFNVDLERLERLPEDISVNTQYVKILIVIYCCYFICILHIPVCDTILEYSINNWLFAVCVH